MRRNVCTHEFQNTASCRYKIIYGSAVLLLVSSQNAMRATRQTINRPTGIPIRRPCTKRVLLNKTQAPSHAIHYFSARATAQKAFIHGHEALRAADTKQHRKSILGPSCCCGGACARFFCSRTQRSWK